MNLITKAALFASKKHSDQRRKYTGEPYFNHCAEVADIVASVPHDDEMLAAAYLHDTVEDTDTTFDEIREQFGARVASMVYFLTDKSKPSDGNRKARKAIDRLHIRDAPATTKTIKLADLISNSKSIVERDPDFAKVYLEEKRLILPFLEEGDDTLMCMAQQFIGDYNGTTGKKEE